MFNNYFNFYGIIENCLKVVGNWFKFSFLCGTWKLNFLGSNLSSYNERTCYKKFEVIFNEFFSVRMIFFINFEFEGPMAWTRSAIEHKSRVLGFKSGGPKYRILVIGVQCMCEICKQERRVKKWKHFQVVFKNEGDFQN